MMRKYFLALLSCAVVIFLCRAIAFAGSVEMIDLHDKVSTLSVENGCSNSVKVSVTKPGCLRSSGNKHLGLSSIVGEKISKTYKIGYNCSFTVSGNGYKMSKTNSNPGTTYNFSINKHSGECFQDIPL